MNLIEHLESLSDNKTAMNLKSLINTLYYSEDVSSIETNRFLIKSNPDRVFLDHAYRFILADMELFRDNIKIIFYSICRMVGDMLVIFYYATYRVEFHICKEDDSIDNDINMQVKISELRKYKIMKEEALYE